MINTSLRDRISCLLRMAEHPASNEHEAALALERAQALLLKNNLTRSDIMVDGEPAKPAGIGQIDLTEDIGYSWKSVLINAIALNSLCSVVRTPSANKVHLFGAYENVQGTLEMYNWIVPELERLATVAWIKYQHDGTGHEQARTFKSGFYSGAISEIYIKLTRSMQDFKDGAGKSLVVVSEQMVKDAVHRVYPHLGHASGGSTRSRDGLNAGIHAGQGLNLNPTRKLSGAGLALGAGR